MRNNGRDGGSDNGPDLGKVGAGLIVGGGMLAAATGVAYESAKLVALGAGILLIGIAFGVGFEGSSGDSGGGLGNGNGGDTGEGETGCFSADTLVLLADRSLKTIGSLQVGDAVMSREEATGRTAAQRISRVWIHRVPSTLVLHLASGEKVETTRHHRFFEARRGFLGAGGLTAGSPLATYAGENVPIASIHPLMRSATVFNLEVENSHTYFVGAQSFWVHNRKISDPFEGD